MKANNRVIANTLAAAMVAIAAGTINVLGDEAQPGQEADKAKHLYAVVIGVDRWLPDAGLPVLLGPTHDAINVATRLHEVGYTIRLLTPASDCPCCWVQPTTQLT